MRTPLNCFLLIAAVLFAGCPAPSSDGDGGVTPVFSAPGSLVPAFGGGIITSNPSGGNDEAVAIVAISSAHFYVAGTKRGTGTSSEVQWQIEKRDFSDGALVASVNSDPSSDVDEPRAMATDGSYLYILGTEGMAWRVEKRRILDLSLVEEFGESGAITSATGSFGSPAAIALDADGSGTGATGYMYIVGSAGGQWRIERRSTQTGALDTGTFGDGTGVVHSDPTFGPDEARAIAIHGVYMFVAGTQGGAWRIERRLAWSGELTMEMTVDPSPNQDEPTAIAIRDDHVYIAGYEDSGNFFFDRRWRIEKRHWWTGELESEFGGGTGIVTSDPSPGDDRPTALFMSPYSSGFLVVGVDEVGTDKRWRVEKRNLATGLLEPDFAAGGILTEDPSDGDDRPMAATLHGNVVFLAGFDSTLLDRQWRVSTWYFDTGNFRPMGNTGVIQDVFPDGSYARSMTTDADSLYVAGIVPRSGDDTWRIEKRDLSNGALHLAIESGSPGSDRLLGSIAVDATHMYIVGSANNVAIIEKRSIADGSLDTEFGTGGVIQLVADSHLESIVLHGPHMFVAGWTDTEFTSIRFLVQKRALFDGALDAGYGELGETGGYDGKARALALDPPYLYIAGDQVGMSWRIEKRNLSDGQLEPSFGATGVVTVDFTAAEDFAIGIGVVGAHVYVGGVADAGEQLGAATWLIQRRSAIDGSLSPSFGVGGTASSNFGSGFPRAFVVDESGAWLGGVSAGHWRIEKRNLADGQWALDFGVGGAVEELLNGIPAVVQALAVTSDCLFAGGQESAFMWRVEKRLK